MSRSDGDSQADSVFLASRETPKGFARPIEDSLARPEAVGILGQPVIGGGSCGLKFDVDGGGRRRGIRRRASRRGAERSLDAARLGGGGPIGMQNHTGNAE